MACYRAENRHDRAATWSPEHPTVRWRSFGYDELLQRDTVNLDIFWLRDDSQDDGAGLDDPDVIALEMVEDLRAVLEELEAIAADLAPPEAVSAT